MTIPVEAGNRAIRDGSLAEVIKWMTERLNPEAAYFLAEDGKRTALIFFDMKSPAERPPIAEPIFMKLNAEVQFIPVMSGEDLQAGLGEVAKNL